MTSIVLFSILTFAPASPAASPRASCALLLASAFAVTTVAPTPSFAADQSDALATLGRQLDDVTRASRAMIEGLEDASLTHRKHVRPEDHEAFVREREQVIDQLGTIRDGLSQRLQIFRAAESSVPTEDLEPSRALIERFDAIKDELDGALVVDDAAHVLGAFAFAEPLLGETGPRRIDLTPFDFTRGFAHQCVHGLLTGTLLHHNARTGSVERYGYWKSGVAITAIKPNGSPELRSALKSGISSAFDPQTSAWVVANPGFLNASASVYNPARNEVEARYGGYRSGIAGVFNPITQNVEWKTASYSGVAGYFDPTRREVVWTTSFRQGVACLWRTEEGHYENSYGFAPVDK